MSKKKEKVIHVDNLIIHAKNVEIVEAEKNEKNHEKNLDASESHNEEQLPMRDPWDFLWGWPQPRELEQEMQAENLENEQTDEFGHEH